MKNKYQEALDKVKHYGVSKGAPVLLTYEKEVDLLQKLVNKETPVKLPREADGYWDGELVYDTAICPNCENEFDIECEEEYRYCPYCGQKLDWSVDEDEL